jgi:hypothetical protein
MESEKKLPSKKLTTNSLSSAIEIQNEHNLMLGDCLTLLKRSMVSLYGEYVSEEIPVINTNEGDSSLVARLNDLNATRNCLLNGIYANLTSLSEQSEINN